MELTDTVNTKMNKPFELKVIVAFEEIWDGCSECAFHRVDNCGKYDCKEGKERVNILCWNAILKGFQSWFFIQTLCMIAVSEIVSKGNVERLGIKNINTIGWIEESWKNRDPHLYGRFDLGYDPQSSSVSSKIFRQNQV